MPQSNFLPWVIAIISIIVSLVTGWANRRLEIGMKAAIEVYIACAAAIVAAVVWQIRLWRKPKIKLVLVFDS